MAEKKQDAMAIIKFKARTYSLHLFFDKNPLWDFAEVEVQVTAVKVPRRLREFGFPGNSLTSIREWMEAHELECVGAASHPSGIGPWKGKYLPPPGRPLAEVLVKPDPAMVLTARILPGDDLNARRVVVALGLEGQGPQAMHSGAFAELQTLIGTALHEVFGGAA